MEIENRYASRGVAGSGLGLGIAGTALGILLGSTFDWKDILCYGLGCLLFAGAELLWSKRSNIP